MRYFTSSLHNMAHVSEYYPELDRFRQKELTSLHIATYEICYSSFSLQVIWYLLPNIKCYIKITDKDQQWWPTLARFFLKYKVSMESKGFYSDLDLSDYSFDPFSIILGKV